MGEEEQAIKNEPESVPAKAAPTDSVIQRRSRWLSSLAALEYVSNVSRDNEIRVRDSDRATAFALLIMCFAALVSLLIPQLENHRLPFVIIADLLVGVALLMYVANRFGILTTFQPRQALLTWQLMLGSSLLGIFLTINLALMLALLVQYSPMLLPH
jgi:hypothetical protein